MTSTQRNQKGEKIELLLLVTIAIGEDYRFEREGQKKSEILRNRKHDIWHAICTSTWGGYKTDCVFVFCYRDPVCPGVY